MNTTQAFSDSNITAAYILRSYHIVPVYVLIVTIISCCLSLVGVFSIFVSYYAIVSIRNYIRKLLLFLTVANLINVIGFIIGLVRYMLLEYTDEKYKMEKQTCVFQSIITSFAPCSSFFWTVIIAVYFQVQVLRPSWADKLSSKTSSVIYHVLSWGIPVVICVIALYFNVFGDTEDIYTGPWCWIKTDQPRSTAIIWMLLTVKGWELLSYLILAEVLVFVVYKKYILPRCFHQQRRSYIEVVGEGINISTRLRQEDKNFVYVWLIFYVLRFGGTFRFLMHAIHGPSNGGFVYKGTDRTMMVWQAFGDTAQAFLNFIVLCVCDKTIRQHYQRRSANDTNTGHVAEDETDNDSGSVTGSLQT